MKYNKILVTGKTGTVGSNFNFGVGYSSRNYDLRDAKQTIELFDLVKPDAVVHCAAKVGGLKLHLEQKYKLFFDNLMINSNVIEQAKNYKTQRVLSYLSSCIFSEKSQSPYSEKDIYNGEPFMVHYPYGHAKRALEVQSRICYEEFGLKYNCIIPTNIYGINDDFNFETGHVVGALIHGAHLSKKNNTEFIVWGDGKQKRDFIFSKDVATLTEWALNEYEDKEPLIFSNNTPIEIGYLAELVAKKFNIENKLVFDTSKPSGQKIRILNGTKIADLTHFKFTSIESGIDQTIDWFLANYPNVRL